MFANDLLQSLVDGPAMMIGMIGRDFRKDITHERARRKLKPLGNSDWQYIANGLAHPTGPCPKKHKAYCEKVKSRINTMIKDGSLRKEILDAIKNIDEIEIEDVNGVEDFLEKTLSNWDWEMFANGLLLVEEK